MHILIIQAHPDATGKHFCHALADAYRRGAEGAGHVVELIDISAADVPILRSPDDFASDSGLPGSIQAARTAIGRAGHIVFVFPLWLGGPPALLKAWLEQVFRNNFAMTITERGWTPHLSGRSARLIVTMAMPALIYRLYFGGHGTGMLRRSILSFCGIRPVRETLIGRVSSRSRNRLRAELAKVERLGRRGR